MTAAPAAEGGPAPLPAAVLARVFLRSLLLQASWNPQGMQNLGLAYALFPALRAIYPDPEAQMAAVRRHLVFFNTHPYVAAAIVGGVIHHEQRIARGDQPADRVVAFKSALMGPLAALGDGFFWLSLKPAVGAFCVALVPWIEAWAAVLFLVLYNAVHFTARARLFWLGLNSGDGLVEGVARAHLPRQGARLRAVAAACAGGVAGWAAVVLGERQGGIGGLWLMVGCLGVGAATYWLLGRWSSGYPLLYLAALLAGLAGFFY